MSIEDTRRLGIEFERRVQTMIPDTEFLDKLDTETIYSFLNQYQDKYVHEIYRNLDQIQSGSHLSAHVESVLQSLIGDATLLLKNKKNAPGVTRPDIVLDAKREIPSGDVIVATGRSVSYRLPNDFYMYIRSVSNVTETFSFKSSATAKGSSIRVLPNQLVSQSDVWKLIETPHDSLRILRYPAATLDNITVEDLDSNAQDPENKTYKVLTVIYDQYTTPEGIKLSYYKQPARFSLMTNTPCDLPLDAFEELVSGAVDLYVQYVAGAEARKRQLDEARRQAAKEQEANNARRGRNNE